MQDFECFTILEQGSVPGLQILSQSGEWILAPPIPGTMVVNIADCLSTWFEGPPSDSILPIDKL
jgi:isopenicillin N synthase-like dioxygenase